MHSINPKVIQALNSRSNIVDLYCEGSEEQIKPSDLEYLVERLPGIASIIISLPEPESLRILSRLPNLRKLHLGFILGTEDFQNELLLFKNLKHLVVERAFGLKSDFFELLQYLPSLTSLQIILSENIYNHDFAQICRIKNLKSLFISGCSPHSPKEFDEQSLQELASAENLNFLGITGCFPITSKGIGYLDKCKNLTGLSLSDIDFTDVKFSQSLKNLRQLTISNSYPEMTDEFFFQISALKKLTFLEVSECKKITDKGLGHILTIPQLKSLILYDSDQITGDCFKIGSLSLKKLFLNPCSKITEDGVRNISMHKNMRDLTLGDLSVLSNKGFVYLSTLTKLMRLNIIGIEQNERLENLVLFKTLKILKIKITHPLSDLLLKTLSYLKEKQHVKIIEVK